MKKILIVMRMYSSVVVMIMAAINAALAQQEVHWLVPLAVNIVGIIVHAIVREVPQPAVTAALAKLRAERA